MSMVCQLSVRGWMSSAFTLQWIKRLQITMREIAEHLTLEPLCRTRLNGCADAGDEARADKACCVFQFVKDRCGKRGLADAW